jgi:hypothetical protein
MIEIEPQLAQYNPQRGDLKTPIIPLHDWQQCMGNSYQNLWWWLAQKFEGLIGYPLTEAGTYSYYHGLNAWLKQERLDWAIYNSEYHTKFLQKALDHIGAPVKIRSGNAAFSSIRAVVENHKVPVVLGTRFSGAGGHIVTVIGASAATLLLSDPYGNPTTGYKNHDGWRAEVSKNFCAGKLSKMIWPEVLDAK